MDHLSEFAVLLCVTFSVFGIVGWWWRNPEVACYAALASLVAVVVWQDFEIEEVVQHRDLLLLYFISFVVFGIVGWLVRSASVACCAALITGASILVWSNFDQWFS